MSYWSTLLKVAGIQRHYTPNISRFSSHWYYLPSPSHWYLSSQRILVYNLYIYIYIIWFWVNYISQTWIKRFWQDPLTFHHHLGITSTPAQPISLSAQDPRGRHTGYATAHHGHGRHGGSATCNTSKIQGPICIYCIYIYTHYVSRGVQLAWSR